MRLFRKTMVVSVFGGLLLWLLELLYSVAHGVWAVSSFLDLARHLLITLLLFIGWGVVAAAAQGLVLAVVLPVHRCLSRRWGEWRAGAVVSAIIAVGLAPYFFFFTARLFSGKGISRLAGVSLLRGTFFISCLAAAFVVAAAVIGTVRRRLLNGRRAIRGFAVAAGALLLGALYILNAGYYVGQYGFVHQAACLIIFLLAEFVVTVAVGRKRLGALADNRTMKIVLFVLCVEVAALSLGTASIPLPSSRLSRLYRYSPLGKQLVWIYGFGEPVSAGAARKYAGYRGARDEFIWSSPKIVRRGDNLIWIMIDAVRADHLAMNGYSRNVAPRLEEFAAAAMRFPRAYSQGYNTETSLPAQMTGNYFSSIEAGGGIEAFETIPELLRRHGYATWALLQPGDIPRLGEKGREGVAFDLVETSAPEYDAAEITKRAMEVLDEREPDTPFFLFLFYGEPHAPYVKHEEFDYGDRAADFYDSEISYVDSQLGTLFEYLRAEGLYGDTIVLVTADHGDELGQHGGWAHGVKLHDAIIHVPLVIRVPGVPPAVVSTPVQTIDIVPTLVEILSLSPRARHDGSSFHPYLAGATPSFGVQVFSEAEFGPTRKVCLIRYPWKLVYHISDAYFSLYNLEEDPREKKDLIGDEEGPVGELKDCLLSWMSYRDRGSREGAEAESDEVAGAVALLRNHDPGGLERLDSVDVRGISVGDFELLAGLLEPQVSLRAASFLLRALTGNERLRSPAVRTLAGMMRGADLLMVESDLDGRRDEIREVFLLLSGDETARPLLELATGDGDDARFSLEIIGAVRPPGARERLYRLYESGGLEERERLFPVLCRLGEARVEGRLLSEAAGMSTYELIKGMSRFAGFRTDGVRDFLMRLVDERRDDPSYPRLLDRMSMEIGKAENEFMLPVLERIFRSGSGESATGARPRLSFARKTAITTYAAIKGRDRLTDEEMTAIRRACREAPHLQQFEDLGELCGVGDSTPAPQAADGR